MSTLRTTNIQHGSAGDVNNIVLNASGDVTIASTLLMSSGTATAPAGTFTGDPNTGIYSPGADQVAVSTGGTQRLQINAAGHVGINTTNPSSLIQVENINSQTYSSSSGKQGHASIQTTNSSGNGQSAALYFKATGNGGTNNARGYINLIQPNSTSHASEFAFQLRNSAGNIFEAARIDSSGNVGIGTSSPDTALDIEGVPAATTGGILRIRDTQTSSSAGKGGIHLSSSPGIDYYIAKDYDPANSPTVGLAFGNASSGAEFMRIDSSGNVGIGTSSPNSKLTLSTGDKIFVPTGEALNFGHTDGSTNTERMRIDSAGNVGVGTTSPVALLQVGTGNPSTPSAKSVFNTNDTANAAIMVSNWTGSATTNGPRIYFDNSGRGRFDIGGGNGTHSFVIRDDQASSDRLTIDSSGRLLVGTSTSLATYLTQINFAGASTNGLYINSSSTSGDGSAILALSRASTPNNTIPALVYVDATATRFELRNNGGLANYQANNVNLSDRSAKKDINPAAGTWNCLKQWEIVNYRYKDQPDNADLSLGVIAQQIAESCPEVITVFEEAKDDQPEKLGIKEQQMYWMAIKALQEAQVRIEALEAEVAALKAQ